MPSPIALLPLSSSLLSQLSLVVIVVDTRCTVAIIVACRAITIELVVIVVRHHRCCHCQYPIAHLAVTIVVVVVVV
jgi:hypothetical protein